MLLAAIAALACAAVADVGVFEWLVGTWTTEKPGGVVVRETWTVTDGQALTGVGQTIRDGKPAATELMTIGAEPAGITFTARVDGQPATPFLLKPGGGEGAVFENLAHDFPQRVIYRPCGEDLCARIEGVVKGRLESEEWRYRRASPAALPPPD